MAIITVIPAVMVFPSLTLKYKANRRVNIIVGIFMVLFDLSFLIQAILGMPPYEIFLAILYLVFTALVVWYAWKWPKPED
jgi:predicted membrane channel-forming protein YqfA (hemolysin III family)